MKKNLKKLLVWILALSMCSGLMTVPALAGEVDPNTNATRSLPAAPGDGSAESPAVTVTVTVQEEGRTTTTTTETGWSGETEVPSETGDGENDGTTTTVTGSETRTETETVDGKGRPVKQTGHGEGSETTVTETVETEVKEGQVIDETVENISSSEETIGETSDYQWDDNGNADDDVDNWVEGSPQFGDWKPTTENTTEGAGQDGWNTTTEDTETDSNDLDIPDPLESKDVTLNLTPGTATTPNTVTEKETVTVEEILAENADMFQLAVMDELEQKGSIETVERISACEYVETVTTPIVEDGVIVGYTIKTTTTTIDPGTISETQTAETRGSVSEPAPSAPVIPETWADALNAVGEVSEITDGDKVIKTATGANGVEVEMIKAPIKDESGNIIGYTIIKKTTTPNKKTETFEAAGENTEDNAPTETTFVLPEKPAESENTENGVTTKVIVENAYDEDGKHVGYISTTVRTNAFSGKELYRSAETIYGTTTTVNKTTVTDPTTKQVTTATETVETEITTIYGFTQTSDVDVTETKVTTGIKTTEVTETEVYQLVETDEGTFFLYQGKMYAVTAIADSHGVTTLNPLQPDKDLITAREGSDLRNKNGTDDGLFSRLNNNSGNPDDFEFRYVGNGLASNLLVNRYNGSSWGHLTNHQFALQDSDGNIHYVYCADIATTAYTGYYYDINNLADADYYQGDDPIAHIRAIALNGYWGTTGDADTTGSLESVKALLREYGYDDVANTLTEGQALTATQAAIWKFGNKDGNRELGSTIVQYDYDGNYIKSSAQDSKNTQILYELLISLTDTTQSETDIIDAEDIKGATIVLDKKAVDENGNVKTDANGNEKYETDLSFTLAVSKSSINGDLLVYVYANGDTSEPVAVKRLAGTNDENESYDTISADENGTYTIYGLELAEGVTITLNLEGTQILEKGVYIYTSEEINDTTSQTFVGVAEGTRKVDLEVNLEFTVTEPTATQQVTKDKTTRTKTEDITETRTGSRVDTRTGITEQTTTSTEITGTKTTVVYADVTVTETAVAETGRAWTEDWEKTYTYSNGSTEEPEDPVVPQDPPEEPEPDPETPDPEEPDPQEPDPLEPEKVPEVVIPEKENELENIPKTGDVSMLVLGLVALFSGGGAVGLTGVLCSGRKEED